MSNTINSFVFYDGTGSRRSFTFSFPYIDRDHVKVYIDEVATGNFTWFDEYEIRMNTAPAAGTKVKIVRETPSDEPLVSIQNGASLLSSDLNIQALQAMFVAQESQDVSTLIRTGTLYSPASDAGRVSLQFPSIEERAGRWLGFDEDGQFVTFGAEQMPKGETGDKGPIGDQGPRGPVGFQGPQGFTGPTGPRGPEGPEGPRGPEGIQGPEGERGPRGFSYTPDAEGLRSQRPTYNSRPFGFAYLAVDTGEMFWKLSDTSGDWSPGVSFGIGPQGIQGQQGIQGATGARGPIGPEGPTGPSGPQGVAGPQGPRASKVAYGSSVTGYINSGDASNGDIFYHDNGQVYLVIDAEDSSSFVTMGTWQGQSGSKGDKGDKGDKGSTGPQGPTGPVGPTGPQGLPGVIPDRLGDTAVTVPSNDFNKATSSGFYKGAGSFVNSPGAGTWTVLVMQFSSTRCCQLAFNVSEDTHESFYRVLNTSWSDWVPVGSEAASSVTPEIYTGSEKGETDFPIGHIVAVSNGEIPNRNAAATIRLASFGINYKVGSGEGAALSGTWRCRGHIMGNTTGLFQKVA